MTVLRMLIFALIMTTVLGGAHYYLWRRLVRACRLPPRWHQVLSWAMLALLASQPILLLMTRRFPREVTAPLGFVAFIWMGLFSTYFVLTSASDLTHSFVKPLRRIFRRADNDEVQDPDRRAAMSRILAGGVTASGTAVGGFGLAQVAAGFSVVRVEVKLNKLPRTFDGYRIVQVSDVHVGPTLGGDFVRSIVETSNEQRADLIAITGDLVDGSVEHLGRHTAPLADLKAKDGAYFVTGNHEYYSGADDWIGELERLGIPTLRNHAIRIERDGESFWLAGVTDHRAGEFGDAPDLDFALRHRKSSEEVVLLAHQPREIDEARKNDVGLQLSGHTHGGQFWPWNWVVHLVQPVVSGLARFGRTQIYVNSGTGYWGPPMRVGTQSEITVVTLRCA